MILLTKQSFRRIAGLFIMGLLTVILISACTRVVDHNAQSPEIARDCRTVQHRLGEACIPLEPQRIIALDVPSILDSLLALDVKPVGTSSDAHSGNGEDWSGDGYFPTLLPELVEEIELIGSAETPSIEKILTLNPDLILLPHYFAKANYNRLSKIAPTVPIDIYNVKADIKDMFRYIAELVSKEEKAEEVLDQYQRKVEELKDQLGDRLSGLEISVISHYESTFYAPPNHASFMQVFRDIGVPTKPILLEQDEWTNFSLEVVERYDADILFIVEDIGGSADFISQHPLILSLEAVENNQAYIVDRRIWDFYGPIGMNLFLDDLSKYLLQSKQDTYFHSSN